MLNLEFKVKLLLPHTQDPLGQGIQGSLGIQGRLGIQGSLGIQVILGIQGSLGI